MNAKFSRGSSARNQADDRGSVQIRVLLMANVEGKAGPKKGNITRTVTCKDATVSGVMAEIKKALFQEDE